MELELKRGCLDTYESCGEVTITQEETAETIVPDYCPDIARIIETEGKIFLHSREVRDGKGEVTGAVRVTVLYIPDGESGIRTLEFALPFTAETESKALPDCVVLCADTEAEYLETRMLNPRKVFTHCKLVTRFSGYRRAPLCFCTDVEAPAELCIEKRQETQHTSILAQITEKDFTFTDEFSLSPGKEGAAEILTSRVGSTVTETKIIGNKLVIKGVFALQLLYRTPSGACTASGGELPFSQILEVGEDSEGMSPSVVLQFTGADLQINSGADQEGRQISVVLYLHATACLRAERDLTLLSDLYSTAYSMSYEVQTLQLTALADTLSRRQTVREVLEIGVVAESILSLSATCSAVSVSREGEMVTLRTGVTMRALYLDEGGVPLVAERSIDVSSQMELPEDCMVMARAACGESPQGSIAAGGIEVRFPVDFQISATSTRKKICLQAAKIASDTPKDLSKAPSLVLRCLDSGETLWDLAKKYNTTIPSILTANALEAGTAVPAGQLLLIPKKRA